MCTKANFLTICQNKCSSTCYNSLNKSKFEVNIYNFYFERGKPPKRFFCKTKWRELLEKKERPF